MRTLLGTAAANVEGDSLPRGVHHVAVGEAHSDIPARRQLTRWIRRWAAVALVATGVTAGCATESPEPASTTAVADRAMDRFLDAWNTGNWAPFLDTTTPEFSFWFPVGPHAGKHEGRAGRTVLGQWAHDNAANGSRLESVVKSQTTSGSRVIYETEATGTAGPAMSYRNWEVLVLTVSGDRISGLHEYWGGFPPP